MHDPMTVAFTIRRPWPRIRRRTYGPDRRKLEARYSWARWWQWNPAVFMSHWRIGPLELYWPSLITFWHVEPSGCDSSEGCLRRQHGAYLRPRWRWHVHHWKLQVHPLQHLRRWALTRCEWCGGRSKRSDYVDVSHQWDSEPGHWWRGERGLFHHDCSSIERAHRVCLCGPDSVADPRPGVYLCFRCGKSRAYNEEKKTGPGHLTNRILASIPDGQRDPGKTAEVRRMWREHRKQQEQAS